MLRLLQETILPKRFPDRHGACIQQSTQRLLTGSVAVCRDERVQRCCDPAKVGIRSGAVPEAGRGVPCLRGVLRAGGDDLEGDVVFGAEIRVFEEHLFAIGWEEGQ